MRSRNHVCRALALAAVSVTGLLTGTAFAGETTDAVTVSFSGSTAMRGFTTGVDFSGLTPGSSLTVNGVTYTVAPTDSANGIFPTAQLAAALGTGRPTPPSPITTTYNAAAYRLEWHEQGSVEGIAEMANDQIGYFNNTPLVATATRGPTSGNPIWVQRSSQTAVGGLIATSNYDTYSATTYTPSTGSNLQGGQNRVQIAISDVRAVQGFSVAGTPAFNRMAGQAGYGKGNPALVASGSLLGLGTGNARRALIDQTALNMETTKVDPQTGATYAAGPWNNAGVANTVSTRVAATATTFAANPGTGLTDVNKSDAQWLQATGRLANGADFNVVTRDINSGTLNVASQNIGLDPSYAVGENDTGNGNLTGGALTAQAQIGATIRFSGKTAGGGQLRPTVQASRMAIGHLSLSDVRGSSVNTAANPVRALGFRNSADNSAAPVQVSIDTINDGSYALFQFENYVTIKNVNSAAATGAGSASAYAALTDAQTGIKGDNTGNDARDFRDNIINSATQFPTNQTFVNPGNGLVAQGFLPAQLLQVTKAGDGEAVTSNPNYNASAFALVRNSSLAGNFAVGAASGVTSGSGSSLYGQGTVADANATTANIALNTGNYLFADFNGDGKRDFQDLKYAQQASTALNASGLTTNWLTPGTAATASASNNTANVYSTFSKGDLIVKGDFNSDGNFDGRDLYAIARGAALADAGKTAATLIGSPDTGTLTTASGATTSDQYRGGKLYKNAALDYLQANTTAAQKASASADSAADPTGTNAFNKFDVNRDGRVNRQDAGIVDAFVGRDYRVLADQLSAVVATNVSAAGTRFVGDPTVDQTTPRKSISLVDVELNDTGDITHVAPAGGTSDFKLIRQALGTAGLLDGDADFDGGVSINDFNALAGNFGVASGQKWSSGDFDFDGGVSINDFNLLAAGFGQSLPAGGSSAGWASLIAFAAAHNDLAAFEAVTGVPEPTTCGLIVAGLTLGLRRRRR